MVRVLVKNLTLFASVLMAVAVAATSEENACENKCCKEFTISGFASFADEDTQHFIFPGDSDDTRIGSGTTFSTVLNVVDGPDGIGDCIYRGAYFTTEDSLAFETSEFSCHNGKIAQSGDFLLVNETVSTFAVTGGTELYEGATGEVIETTNDGVSYNVQINIKTESCM